MIDFNAWLAEEGPALDQAPARAVFAWRHILDKPTSVRLRKPDRTILDAQTVRIEYSDAYRQATSVAGAAVARRVVIYGVRNHPDEDVPDTIMGEGYVFVHENDQYRIHDVIHTDGEVQGFAEVTA